MDFYQTLTHIDSNEVEQIKQAQNGKPLHAFLLDTEKWDDEKLLEAFPDLKPHLFIPHCYYYKKETYDLGKDFIYDMGLISIQDPAAMLVPLLLHPKKGDRVLDLCAAPGGKSIFASLMMQQSGLLISNDISYPRAKNLSQNVERMGLRNIIVTNQDFETVYRRFAGFFDKIILDVPCSGSAMFRKDELSRTDWSIEKVKRNAEIAARLLSISYEMLAPGGTMMFSTCSYSYEENEGNILPFLETYKDMRPIIEYDHPCFYHPKTLKEACYIFPHRYAGEGQFFVLLKKDGESASTAPILSKQVKTKNVPADLTILLDRYGLSDLSIIEKNKTYYGIEYPIDLSGIKVLRYGVELAQNEGHFVPSHHFARSIPASKAIPLDPAQAKLYLEGNTFPCNEKDGFYVVSYQGLSMGWVKITKGVAKNHYPKGLRHSFKFE